MIKLAALKAEGKPENIVDKIAEGKVKAKDFPEFGKETGFRAPQTHFIDGITYDGTQPNEYLTKFKIGLKGKDKL